jgi:hypothetical protein
MDVQKKIWNTFPAPLFYSGRNHLPRKHHDKGPDVHCGSEPAVDRACTRTEQRYQIPKRKNASATDRGKSIDAFGEQPRREHTQNQCASNQDA